MPPLAGLEEGSVADPDSSATCRAPLGRSYVREAVGLTRAEVKSFVDALALVRERSVER